MMHLAERLCLQPFPQTQLLQNHPMSTLEKKTTLACLVESSSFFHTLFALVLPPRLHLLHGIHFHRKTVILVFSL